MQDIKWFSMLLASPTMLVLLACSVVSLVFILERGIYYLRHLPDAEGVLQRLDTLLREHKFAAALDYCGSLRGPLGKILHAVIAQYGETSENLNRLLSSLMKKEEVRLERFLGILGTLGNTSPFIGLLGTVIGIIKAFQSLALAGSGGPNVVAAGIAEALVATAAGLAVAIPAVIFYNFYISKVRQTMTDIEAAAEHVQFLLKKSGALSSDGQNPGHFRQDQVRAGRALLHAGE